METSAVVVWGYVPIGPCDVCTDFRYGVSASFYPPSPDVPQHLLLGRVMSLLPEKHHFQVHIFIIVRVIWQCADCRTIEGTNPSLAPSAGIGVSLLFRLLAQEPRVSHEKSIHDRLFDRFSPFGNALLRCSSFLSTSRNRRP